MPTRRLPTRPDQGADRLVRVTGDERSPTSPSLCTECLHARVVRSTRGAVFYLCERSFSDPTYPKYPAVPVIRCAGYVGVETVKRT
jgi:hypothetical protein